MGFKSLEVYDTELKNDYFPKKCKQKSLYGILVMHLANLCQGTKWALNIPFRGVRDDWQIWIVAMATSLIISRTSFQYFIHLQIDESHAFTFPFPQEANMN